MEFGAAASIDAAVLLLLQQICIFHIEEKNKQNWDDEIRNNNHVSSHIRSNSHGNTCNQVSEVKLLWGWVSAAALWLAHRSVPPEEITPFIVNGASRGCFPGSHSLSM